MAFPFFQDNTIINQCFYNQPLLSHVASGDVWSSRNIHISACLADSAVRPFLGLVPNYGNQLGYMPYVTPSLTAPGLGSVLWTEFDANGNFRPNINWGGNNIFGNTNMWGNNGGNIWGNLGWFPGRAGNAPSTPTTPEEIRYEKYYNKLKKLAEILQNYEGINDVAASEIKSQLENPTGDTFKTRYENLKKAYDKITDKALIKKCLIENRGLLVLAESGDNTLDKRLLEIGFECESTIDKAVEAGSSPIQALSTAIDGITKENPSTDTASGAVSAVTVGTYDILDFISSWNTYHQGTDKRNVIKSIMNKYNDAGDNKDTVKAQLLKPLVDSLATKASGLKNKVDSNSAEEIQEAINKLNKSLEKCDASLATDFDKLYVITRKAATAVLNKELRTEFGSIDSVVFSETMFTTDMNKDLKEEGLEDVANSTSITVTPVNITEVENEKEKKEKIEEEATALNNKALDEQEKELTETNTVLTKLEGEKVKVGEQEYSNVYVETKAKEGKKPRVIVKTGDGWRVVVNATVENNKVKEPEATKPFGLQEVKASALKENYDAIVKTEEAQEELEELESQGILIKEGSNYVETNGQKRKVVVKDGKIQFVDGSKYTVTSADDIKLAHSVVKDKGKIYNLTPEEKKAAQEFGVTVCFNLDGYTTDREWDYVYNYICTDSAKINKNTVFEFLKGYEASSPTDSFFEQIDDEMSRTEEQRTEVIVKVATLAKENLEARIQYLKANDLEVDPQGFTKTQLESDINALKDYLKDSATAAAKADASGISYEGMFDRLLKKYIEECELGEISSDAKIEQEY